MTAPRKSKLLAVLMALAFMLVQFVDLAVLDNQHASAAEAYTGLDDYEADHEDDHEEGGPACAEHCACHMLHHAYAGGSPNYGLDQVPRPTRHIEVSSWFSGPTTLPPVPPPIS